MADCMVQTKSLLHYAKLKILAAALQLNSRCFKLEVPSLNLGWVNSYNKRSFIGVVSSCSHVLE